jgi:hypothetical protein
MSDFFSGINNARYPDLVMNHGPLPPLDGLPAPLHDTADGRINASDSLLGNLAPYAYGEPGYQSSQVSYVNHPHRIQKIFPELRLPRGLYLTQDDFPISHTVDDSDIAFTMRLDRASSFCTLLKNPTVHRYKLGTAIDPFINLATVNYILGGLQLCMGNLLTDPANLWKTLLHNLDKEYFNENKYTTNEPFLSLEDLVYIVRELIKPFGVVRGSEKQGGLHEMTNSPVTWPVNFVGTLVIDGKERNVLNYWHNHDISAGDDLCFRLKPMPIPKQGYTLNHYFKHVSKQDFKQPLQNAVVNATHIWQLVPDILDLHARDEFDPNIIMPCGNFRLAIPQPYVWQEWGYWHIGRTQIRANKTSVAGDYYNDDMAMNLRLAHLDMTFTPIWQKVPGRPLWSANYADPNKTHPKFSALNQPVRVPEKTMFLDTLLGSRLPQPSPAAPAATEDRGWFSLLATALQTPLSTVPETHAVLNTSTANPSIISGTTNYVTAPPSTAAGDNQPGDSNAPQSDPDGGKQKRGSFLDFTGAHKKKSKKNVVFNA